MIYSCILHKKESNVIEIFDKFQKYSIKADNQFYTMLLVACTESVSLKTGQRIHNEIIKNKINMDRPLVNSLINMYIKCGSLESVWKVFDKA